MNSRYVTNIGLALMGGFLVVVSQAWSVSVFMWVMLGIGAAAVALAGSIALPGRGRSQRILDGIIGVMVRVRPEPPGGA